MEQLITLEIAALVIIVLIFFPFRALLHVLYHALLCPVKTQERKTSTELGTELEVRVVNILKRYGYLNVRRNIKLQDDHGNFPSISYSHIITTS
jgi:hypothetical protein